MGNQICKFCERLKLYKEIREERNRFDKDCIHDEYTVALVVRSRRHRKLMGGRLLSFRNKGIGFSLNYCPECGKELKCATFATNTKN